MEEKEECSIKQYQDFTRYLRPVKPIQYSNKEMMRSMLQYLEPDEIASMSQLLGERAGVIRVTFKTMSGVKAMEDMVIKRKISIQTIPLGLVDEHGQFIMVVMENVPHYVSDDMVDEAMAQYGCVAGSSREYIEYRGRRIENERRKVLFTSFKEKAVVPSRLKLFDTTIYTQCHGQGNCGICVDHTHPENKGQEGRNKLGNAVADSEPILQECGGFLGRQKRASALALLQPKQSSNVSF